MMSTLCCFAIVERSGKWSPEHHATASQQSSAGSNISSNSDATHTVQLTFGSQRCMTQPQPTSIAQENTKPPAVLPPLKPNLPCPSVAHSAFKTELSGAAYTLAFSHSIRQEQAAQGTHHKESNLWAGWSTCTTRSLQELPCRTNILVW